MRRFVSLFIIFFCLPFAFSYGGFMSGEKSLRVVKTEWFDIIFPEKCEPTARKIASVADSYYSEISSKLGTEPYQRFPVSITSSIEDLNAFFSPAPYNMICLYDTALDENLDSSEGIESVFYHELTHAVTLNMKSPFWRGLSVMSDLFTLPGISLTSFWYEGAAVSFESLGEGGRLNSPFFTQVVAQAKIDGKFPSWRDVTGARDVYPSGSVAYYFGGAFAKYLQKTYGMEKYGEFWKRAGKSTTLSFCAGVFKKVYGLKMSRAWQDFYDSIEVPSEFVEIDYSLVSRKNSVVTAFDSVDVDGRTFVAYFDSLSSAVFLWSSDLKKSKRLFSVTGVRKIRFSPDGKYLAVSRVVSKDNVKSEIGIYGLSEKKYRRLKLSGVKNASVCASGGGFFVTAFDFKSAEKRVVRFRFGDVFSSSFDFSVEKSFPLSDCETAYSISDIDSSRTALVVKNSLSWKIRVVDFSNGSSVDYDFGKNIVHNLHVVRSSEKVFLAFSYATLGEKIGSLSKMAFAELKDEGLEILSQSVPLPFGVVDFSFGESGFVFVGEKYVSKPLCFAGEIPFEENPLFEPAEKSVFKNDERSVSEVGSSGEDSAAPAESEKIDYNPVPYFLHGAFLPFSLSCVYDSDFSPSAYEFLGATFASSTPWTDKITIFSSGYSPFSKTCGFSLSLNGGDDSLSYALSASGSFDSGGFLQTVDSVSVSKVLHRFLAGFLSFGGASSFFYGDEHVSSGFAKTGLRSKSNAYLTFSTKRKFRPEVDQIAGFSFTPFVVFDFKNLGYVGLENKVEKKYLNAGGTFSARIPGPFPISLGASAFPEEGVFLAGSASVILFSFEIQKGVPALSVYANRLSLAASYSPKVSYAGGELFDIGRIFEIARDVRRSDYSDAAALSVCLAVSPNTSYFVSAVKVGLQCDFVYRPNPAVGKDDFSFGLSLNASY